MNGLCLILLFGGFILVSSELHEKPVYDLEEADLHFEEFINKFDKQYASEEEKQLRFNVFKKNLQDINQKNEKNPNAVFAVNSFSDLERDEFKQMYTGLIVGTDNDYCKNKTNKDVPSVQAPESFDWRDKNVVTPVKDQKSCGSCWAFSTTGNIEGVNAIKTGELVSVSEQQLLDCNMDNDGCQGGYMADALGYIVHAGGIMSENDYRYMAKRNEKCLFNKGKVAVKLSGCNMYNLTTEEKLKDLLYSNGPLAVAVNAEVWSDYTSGIITDCDDHGARLNHGVTLVGYGVEKGVPFWTLKNSWGPDINDDGYVRIERGANTCLILNPYTSSAVI